MNSDSDDDNQLEDKVIEYDPIDDEEIHTEGKPSIKYEDIDKIVVDSFLKYEDLYRLRHDIFHKFVCDSRGLSMGELPVKEFFSDISNHPRYTMICEQTPDSITVTGRSVKIIEVAVSYSNYTYTRKFNKYHLLKEVLMDCGYAVDLEIIIMPLGATTDGIIDFCNDYLFDVGKFIECSFKVEKVDRKIQEIESNHPQWVISRLNEIKELPDINISNEEILNLFDNSERKPFRSKDDLVEFLVTEEPESLTYDDNRLLNYAADRALMIDDLELLRSEKLNTDKFWDYHDKMNEGIPHTPQGNTFISVSPLPLLLPTSDLRFRSTENDDQLVLDLKKRLSKTDDPYLLALSRMNIKPGEKETQDLKKMGLQRVQTECIGHVQLTADIKWQIALEGPGRKHFIKKSDPSPLHVQSQRENTMYITGSKLDLTQLSDMIWMFSRKNVISDITNPSGSVWTYLRFVQSVYQEININFLRKELRKNHIIKPTIYNGVFVVIHRGPPYLTGAKQSMVWFKLVGYTEDICADEFTNSWMFKKIKTVGNNVWMTRWISSDPHRLTHYIRIYDKVLMAYLTYLHGSRVTSSTDQTLLSSYNDDTTDALGLIAMIYLENKRCTSKTLQDVRYVIMSTMSHCQFWNDLLEKFMDPIRSPLQLYIIRNIVNYIEKSQFNFIRKIIKNSRFGKVIGDISGLDTKKSGADIKLPRILTRTVGHDPEISFQQMLCEMYFTMLFNKDQDDPTHSSFQVLEKILKGEHQMEKIKHTSGLHVGLRIDEFEDFKYLINSKKQPNQFSSRAIIIASKLQNKSKHNRMKGTAAFEIANTTSIVNRSIDDFATFKSSATFPNDHHRSNIVGFMQNPRRRCIEGVYQLQKENMFTSVDVFNKTKNEETSFQVFKKNQIGGVREILILSISTRIRINILESYCRVLCSFDEREMLTHGSQKNSRFVGIQQNLKLGSKESIMIHHNYDKKRWGPSFMPIQFMYMFKPFQKSMGKYFQAFLHMLIKHTNKRCYYPDHLTKAWINNVDRDHTRDPLLTIKKREFLQDKKLYFINESNMGQGILHYTSSLFHLGAISLRSEIYKRMCKIKGFEPCEIEELVSSDDSYSAQCISKKEHLVEQINLFLRAQSVTERLLNIETSKSKSSMSPIVGEFNSLFISNLTTFPTLLKFSLASVDTYSTDSFTHIIKESFNSMRMMFENGGSLELYNVAYLLNKNYAETMYHTSEGDWNDPSLIFDMDRSNIPYQFGVYPIAPTLCLLMMGPEAHNYRIVSEMNKMEDCIKKKQINKIFTSAHTIVSDNMGEYASNLSANDDLMIGATNIVAITRMNRKLKAIRNRCGVDRFQIKQILIKDPLFPLRKPVDLEESILKTRMKLLQSSAIDAIKVTSGSLYFGRVSATATAKCFRSMHNPEVTQTFKECLYDYYNIGENSITENLFIFNEKAEEYQNIDDIASRPMNMKLRDNLETRMYRKLFLDDLRTGLVNPIHMTLGHFWNPNRLKDDISNSIIRDWIMIKRHIPLLDESLNITLQNLDPDREKAVTKLLLLLMRLTGTEQSTLKGFLYGDNSKNYEMSAEIIQKENSYPFMTCNEFSSNIQGSSTSSKIDKMLLLYNEFLLRKFCDLPVEHLSEFFDLSVMMYYCSNKNTPPSHKKRLFAMALYFNMIDSLDEWTTKVSQVVEYWTVPQLKTEGGWAGDCEMFGYYGDAKAMIKKTRGQAKLVLSPSQNDVKNFVLIRHMVKSLDPEIKMTDDNLRSILGEGNFSIFKSRLVQSGIIGSGFKIIIDRIPLSRPHCKKLVLHDGFFDLLDHNERRFMRCQLGLFNVDKYEIRENFDDFSINNFSFLKMVNMRAFSSNFNLMTHPEKELLELLDDNHVRVLVDQHMVNEFLTAPKRIYNRKDGNSPLEFMDFDEEDIEIDDLYQQILELDEKEPFELKDLQVEENTYVDELFESEMFTRHIIGKIDLTPTKTNLILWNRIILLKSFIILRLWTGKTFIGQRGINAMINMGVSSEVIIACMNVYFVLKTRLSGSDSPGRVHFVDCLPYVRKFGTRDEEWFEYYENNNDL
jgi:hypothetical protein